MSISELQDQGYTFIRGFLSAKEVEYSNIVLQALTRRIDDIKISKGIKLDGGYHHIISVDYNFYSQLYSNLEKLETQDKLLKEYFGSSYILNSYGAAVNLAEHDSDYLHKYHKDIRSAPGKLNYMLNILIMLDDFTEKNGATYLIPESHKFPEDMKTLHKDFEERAIRLTGKAGDMVLFNSACWHKAGDNTTYKQRRGLTINLSRNFIKPQFDYCRWYNQGGFLGRQSAYMQQLLGYNHRIPETLDDWYQSDPKKRFYKGD